MYYYQEIIRQLLPIINELSLPTRIVISSGWRGYSELQKQGYEHQTIMYKYSFIDPDMGAHVQTIESPGG